MLRKKTEFARSLLTHSPDFIIRAIDGRYSSARAARSQINGIVRAVVDAYSEFYV
jgi:hypothetical protein